MRILRILTRLAGGGPPLHALTLNRALRERGHEAWLAVGECESNEKAVHHLAAPADQLIRISALRRRPSPRQDFAALCALVVLMRQLEPDIVHTHTAKAGALGRIAARLAGVAAVVHTFHGHVMRGYFAPPVNRLVQGAERALGGCTDAIVALSAGLRRELVTELKIAPEDRVHTIPLGPDLSAFTALPLPEPPGDAPVIAWIGRMVDVKNLPLLARTVAATLARLPGARFVLAGDGPERPLAEDLARRYPESVEVLPWVERPAVVLERAHLLVLTSHNEGTPVALIEGLAAGRPFVSTAVGGVPELAAGGWGVAGPPDAEVLAQGIESLVSAVGDWSGRSQAARAFAGRNFSVDAMAERHVALYRDLLAAEGRCRDVDAHLAARC